MIDTHIHMVPSVDDGASDLEMSMSMVKMAMDQGVDAMILTPHYYVPVFISGDIDENFELLKKEIKKNKLAFELHLGNEIHVNEESIKGLISGKARTMGDSDYLLMELPFHHYYPFHESMLFDLQIDGYKIILAHVERYRAFRNDETKLNKLINKGFYGQITARYVAESKTRKRALRWIEEGYIHVVASDGHNVDKRPPLLKEAFEMVERKFGRNCALTLFEENPRRIIENQPLKIPTIKKRKWLGGWK